MLWVLSIISNVQMKIQQFIFFGGGEGRRSVDSERPLTKSIKKEVGQNKYFWHHESLQI